MIGSLWPTPTSSKDPFPVLSFYHSEHPKIWLPRALRQTYIRKVGDTVNLLIPFQVITPTPCWDQVRALTWRQN